MGGELLEGGFRDQGVKSVYLQRLRENPCGRLHTFLIMCLLGFLLFSSPTKIMSYEHKFFSHPKNPSRHPAGAQ